MKISLQLAYKAGKSKIHLAGREGERKERKKGGRERKKKKKYEQLMEVVNTVTP